MVIVNADDFGMNESCSRAICEAFRLGLVTDTTMMANGRYFDEAVRLAKENGFFDKIGIHLNLTEGEPLTEEIKAFPEYVRDGRFHKQRDMTKPPTRELESAVYAELRAQIEKLRDAGIAITHADSHHYVHTTESVIDVAVKVLKEYSIRKVRLRLNLGDVPDTEKSEVINQRLRNEGFVTVKHFVKLAHTKQSGIPDNTEILVHPDYDRYGRLIDRRGVENGCPVGEPIPKLNTALGSYAEL